ncbi:MAG: AAA family ATPase [Flavobacteriaceae bacterium]|nr:MAG: AAA family ATPase [Flavobacteriaceae bacterium]
MAHLVYAVLEGEGFISLTGKRGVGKTTICQTFIDRQDENTEVAYIYKPELSPEKLLKKINSAFSIRDDTDDIKELIDSLNSFLIQMRAAGKKVVLFLDDAQNLKTDVLEQVRLLSNLETTRDKLLQIILVGEPELADMLDSHALRQIGQRVSVSYNISPLTYEETCAYIYHRMSIASQGTRVLFDTSTLKHIYRFSNGIPRMINVECDRSLLIAYNLKRSGVTEEIARTAILGLSNVSDFKKFGVLKRHWAILTIIGCCLLLFTLSIAFFHQGVEERSVIKQEGFEQAATRSQRPSKLVPTPLRASQKVEMQRIKTPKLQNNDQVPTNSPVKLAPKPDLEKSFLLTVKMTYSVQVGAYRIKSNAIKRIELLKEKGYPGRILSVTDSAGEILYTVRIGDFPSHESARQYAAEFSAKEKMKTAVRPYGKL